MVAYAPRVSEALPSAFGDYLLLEKLGQGATAEVFLARPRDAALALPAPLVIKRLHAAIAREERFVQRFRHEAEIAVRVDSAHVARVYDVGAVGEALYFAMEHVAGASLATVMTRAREQNQPIAPRAALELIAQALAGLEALHTLKNETTGEPLRFAHRDLAPKNLMLGDDGRVRVIDLGLGRSEAQEWRTRAGAVMGSIGYMSPEQVSGKPVDHRTDLYTLGIVLFELLAGRPLISGTGEREIMQASLKPEVPSLAALRGDVPMEIDAILRKALAKKVEDRFQTASAFAAAIDRTIDPQARAGSLEALRASLNAGAPKAPTPQLPTIDTAIPEPSKIESTVVFARQIPPAQTAATRVTPPRPKVAKRASPPRAWIAAALLLVGALLGVVARLAWAVL